MAPNIEAAQASAKRRPDCIEITDLYHVISHRIGQVDEHIVRTVGLKSGGRFECRHSVAGKGWEVAGQGIRYGDAHGVMTIQGGGVEGLPAPDQERPDVVDCGVDAAGVITIKIKAQQIEIRQLTAVTRHTIGRATRLTSHEVQFAGAGLFTCTDDAKGQVMALRSRNLLQKVDPSGRVSLIGTDMADELSS